MKSEIKEVKEDALKGREEMREQMSRTGGTAGSQDATMRRDERDRGLADG